MKMSLISLVNIIPCVGFTQKNSNNDIKISFYMMSLELSLNHYYKLKKNADRWKTLQNFIKNWWMKIVTKIFLQIIDLHVTTCIYS